MRVKPRPSTDGALAMGLLKVVVEERLYDKDFVHDWTVGFDGSSRRSPPPRRCGRRHLGARGADPRRSLG